MTVKKIWKTEGQEGCDDCQWLAHETDGEWLICDECHWVLQGEDDGQPDWAQEWHDFDPDCQAKKSLGATGSRDATTRQGVQKDLQKETKK